MQLLQRVELYEVFGSQRLVFWYMHRDSYHSCSLMLVPAISPTSVRERERQSKQKSETHVTREKHVTIEQAHPSVNALCQASASDLVLSMGNFVRVWGCGGVGVWGCNHQQRG